MHGRKYIVARRQATNVQSMRMQVRRVWFVERIHFSRKVGVVTQLVDNRYSETISGSNPDCRTR